MHLQIVKIYKHVFNLFALSEGSLKYKSYTVYHN